MKPSTCTRSASDCFDNSRAAVSTWPDAAPVSVAAWVTAAMLDDTSAVPAEKLAA